MEVIVHIAYVLQLIVILDYLHVKYCIESINVKSNLIPSSFRRIHLVEYQPDFLSDIAWLGLVSVV